MAAPTYDTLTTDDTGADKILTTGTMTALDQNPVSIAQRGTDAPVVQVSVHVQKNPGDTSWAWPDGVTAAYFRVQAGGGGGSDGTGPAAGAGGNTTVTYDGTTYTANGGSGGSGASTVGAAGSGGNCPIKENGRGDGSAKMGAYRATNTFYGYGGGGAGDGHTANRGGAGEYGEVRLVRVSGLNTVTIAVGAGGTNTYTQVVGADGVMFIEY